MLSKCVFCKIIKGEIHSNIVEQTKHALAFRDINPKAPTHVLIVPKEHIASCRDLNEHNVHYLSEMAFLAQKVAAEDNITENGYRWIINTGNAGGQTVEHIHLHLMGGRDMKWPPG